MESLLNPYETLICPQAVCTAIPDLEAPKKKLNSDLLGKKNFSPIIETESEIGDNKSIFLYWDLFRLCNFSSFYCSPLYSQQDTDDRMELDHYLKIWNTYLDYARLYFEEKSLIVSLLGGEPLLLKGLPKLIEQLNSSPAVRSVKVVTNGYLPAKSLAELLSLCDIAWSIHFDENSGRTVGHFTEKYHELFGLQKSLGSKSLQLKIMRPPGRVEDGFRLAQNILPSLEDNTFQLLPVRNQECNSGPRRFYEYSEKEVDLFQLSETLIK